MDGIKFKSSSRILPPCVRSDILAGNGVIVDLEAGTMTSSTSVIEKRFTRFPPRIGTSWVTKRI